MRILVFLETRWRDSDIVMTRAVTFQKDHAGSCVEETKGRKDINCVVTRTIHVRGHRSDQVVAVRDMVRVVRFWLQSQSGAKKIC